MRAVRLHEIGTLGPASLRLEEVPEPQPGPGQVLLRVTHSGVWNVVAVARAAPGWNASPGRSAMLALHTLGVVAQLTGMSLAEWTSTTFLPTF